MPDATTGRGARCSPADQNWTPVNFVPAYSPKRINAICLRLAARRHRGRGYGIAIVEAAVSHPDVRSAAITLETVDAHDLYRRFGFAARANIERAMMLPGTFLSKPE